MSSWQNRDLKSPSYKNPDQTPVYSVEFPKEYGDFALQSSDGILFGFPRLLLCLASPIFKDMLEIGDSTREREIVTLAEDRQSIEFLLQHIDPGKPTPELDWKFVTKILTMGDKYQIPSIHKWFEMAVACEVAEAPSLSIKEPMICLELAIQYELPLAEKLALRQLCKSSAFALGTHKTKASQAFEKLIAMRSARISHITTKLFELERNQQKNDCFRHGKGARAWLEPAVATIGLEPSWTAFYDVFEGAKKSFCACGKPLITAKWKEETFGSDTGFPEVKPID